MKNLKNALLLKQLYQLKQLGYRYTSVVPYKEEEPAFMLPDSLQSLNRLICDCHLCTLCKTRERIVFSHGDLNAELMIVGDSPSNSDESLGKIFTGRTGEILTKMIQNVLQIQIDNVYLTNILKCKSHQSQDISPKHALTCLPYLLKEIEIVRPKVILTLGESTYSYLSGDNTPLEQIRGSIQNKDSYILVPTYHPAYLLRNPSAKKDVFTDLLKIKDLLQK